MQDCLKVYHQNKNSLVSDIHPNDDMFAKTPGGWSDYKNVGVSAIEAIDKAVASLDIRVQKLLDFGCGHGRVGRHLPLAFPNAEYWFSDTETSGWKFCAEKFDGNGFPANENLEDIELPQSFDLIWVGSVFTHLDWNRCSILIRKLASALSKHGVLVATFRGEFLYKAMKTQPEIHNVNGYYNQIIEDYERTGFGYMDYKGFVNWGQNLIASTRLAELPGKSAKLKLLNVQERGWANRQDVVSWQKR